MRRAALLAGPAAALALLLSACGAGTASPSPGPAAGGGSEPADAAAFPVSIEHALGTTVVPDAPERVVTWGWGSTEAALALGVTPVAMAAQTYAGDDEGVLPWVREHVEAAGEELPVVLPDSQEPPLEAIAAAAPDLIVAPYSGLTQSEYDLLEAIAPTLAYPDQPWATPWRDTVTLTGTALGLGDEAEQLVADLDAEVAAVAVEHPELAGSSVAVTFPSPDTVYVYKPADARVDFLLDLGLTGAPSVEALASGDSSFYFTLSPERLDELASDVLVLYADTEGAAQEFLDSPAARLMPQVRSGAVATIVGPELVSAVSPPTALSLRWGLETYADALASAAARAAG